jgi:hypothetical protein
VEFETSHHLLYADKLLPQPIAQFRQATLLLAHIWIERSRACDVGVAPCSVPAAALLGIALTFAAPLALVATHLTMGDKSAAIDTVSDPIAETEWYITASNPIAVDLRTARDP